MIKNKKLLFVVTAVLFLLYTVGVVITTLQIGFDVLRIEPNWLAVALSCVLMLTTMLPVYAIVSLALAEHTDRSVTIEPPVIKPPPDFDEAWIHHFQTDEERREFIRERKAQHSGIDLDSAGGNDGEK